MKMRKKAALAAAILTAATMNFSACSNINGDVYGPPPETFEDDYEPSDNINGGVYGPPEEDFWQEESVTETSGNDESIQTEEDVSDE